MHPNAKKLNDCLKSNAEHVHSCLSELGKSLFLPKGIFVQGAEAQKKATRINASIGIATHKGAPLYLESMHKNLYTLNPSEVFLYAGNAGYAPLRKLWKEKIYTDNPSLPRTEISTPVATAGITHGLALVGDLFVNRGDTLILPDQFWDNYTLTYVHRYGARFSHYSFFNSEGTFNIKGFQKCLAQEAERSQKLIILLNFPNNPTGYSPNTREAHEITETITRQAEQGSNILCMIDDAYFGFFYENAFQESLFSLLSQAHKRIITVKLDGATKEYYAWGLRVGFCTFALKEMDNIQEVYLALEEKLTGAIRSSISNVSQLSQTLLYKALLDSSTHNQKAENSQILLERAQAIQKIITQEKYKHSFKAYPCNSGYFITLKLYKDNAEALRLHLLNAYQTGVIMSTPTEIRIAFSCVDKEMIPELFDNIHKAILDLQKETAN